MQPRQRNRSQQMRRRGNHPQRPPTIPQTMYLSSSLLIMVGGRELKLDYTGLGKVRVCYLLIVTSSSSVFVD